MDEQFLLVQCVDNCKEFQRLAGEAESLIRNGLKGETAQCLYDLHEAQIKEINDVIRVLSS